MTRTNIRRASELLKHNKWGGEEICLVPDASSPGGLEKLILLSGGACDDHEFVVYTEVFSRRVRADRWVNLGVGPEEGARTPSGPDSTVTPPNRVGVPRVVASLGTTQFWLPATGRRQTGEGTPPRPSDLMYLAVVAGNSGAQVVKFFTAKSLEKLTNWMYAEVLNGYSTVFTGACFQSEWARREQGNATLSIVHDLEGLRGLREDNESGPANLRPRIGILC
ncbi:uncharacterized protein AB675_11697 [Cyphellophora attinorum]|uniref:Uncharacterized protein n=1 Tax=Cyphellophora attinorum TaxID=1664694 RepID=A0A0N1GY22_9EURO|nr:uncharacterized protein AB675_11697 [Phialophora attinorum]KPI35397.1 hypothetical protein AB675_11697 [Phialophora attinorum]